MRAILACLAIFVALPACEQIPDQPDARQSGAPTLATCAGSSAPSCRFRNSPVRLVPKEVRLPKRALPFYPTAEELEFLDAKRRSWIAPPNTLTDGASIPQVFVSIIGNPTSREFANAAAIHDAYCGVGNEDGPVFQAAEWRQVHRMFYDALRVGGTPEIKAKIMFAAVYIGGPRWGGERRTERDSVARNTTLAGASVAGWNGTWQMRDAADLVRGNQGLSPTAMRRVLRQTIGYIETQNPTLPQIEGFAEAAMSRTRNQSQQGAGENGIGQGGVGDPTTEAPAPGDPATAGGDPTTGDPTAGDPATGAPGTETATDPAIGGTQTGAGDPTAI